MNNPTVCSQCGAALRPDAVFCIACGHTVRPMGAGPAPPPGQSAQQPPSAPDPTRMYQTPPPNWAAPPPPSGYMGYSPASVKTYLVESVLATIFCCVPLGIIAIVFAVQADGHLKSGNLAMAVDASGKAKMFMLLSVILGFIATCGWLGIAGLPLMLG